MTPIIIAAVTIWFVGAVAVAIALGLLAPNLEGGVWFCAMWPITVPTAIMLGVLALPFLLGTYISELIKDLK